MRKQPGRKQGGDRRCSSELRSQGCLVCLGHTEVGSLTSYMKTSSRTQALLVLVAIIPQHLVWCSADHQCSRNACSHNPRHGEWGGGPRARWQAEDSTVQGLCLGSCLRIIGNHGKLVSRRVIKTSLHSEQFLWLQCRG